MSMQSKLTMIEPTNQNLSIRTQCSLLGLNRSNLYYQPSVESDENLHLMKLLDEEYTRYPFKGVLKMQMYLKDLGYQVNPKRVRRLLRTMGIMAVYPKKNLSNSSRRSLREAPFILGDCVLGMQIWRGGLGCFSKGSVRIY